MKSIAICASITFYQDVMNVKHQLEKLGLAVYAPALAEIMEKENNFHVEHYKDTFYGEGFAVSKARAIREHFEIIKKCNATLVVNNTKNGIEGYIGPNVLMELAVAFSLNQPLYLLNPYPENSPFLDELQAMQPVILQGDLSRLLEPHH